MRASQNESLQLSHSLDALAVGDARREPVPLTSIDLATAIRSAVALARPAFDRRRASLEARLPMRLQARTHPDGK